MSSWRSTASSFSVFIKFFTALRRSTSFLPDRPAQRQNAQCDRLHAVVATSESERTTRSSVRRARGNRIGRSVDVRAKRPGPPEYARQDTLLEALVRQIVCERRLVRAAIAYALDDRREANVVLLHTRC